MDSHTTTDDNPNLDGTKYRVLHIGKGVQAHWISAHHQTSLTALLQEQSLVCLLRIARYDPARQYLRTLETQIREWDPMINDTDLSEFTWLKRVVKQLSSTGLLGRCVFAPDTEEVLGWYGEMGDCLVEAEYEDGDGTISGDGRPLMVGPVCCGQDGVVK